MRVPVALAPWLLLMVGCNDNSFTRAVTRDVFEQAPSNSVDILWVMDNSISMQNEQEAVAAGAQDFADRLVNTDIDFHLGVVSTDMSTENADAGALLGSPKYIENATPNYVQAFQQRVLLGTGGDDQERGLQAAITALTPPMTDNRNYGFLRDDAMLSIIVVSDENDCSDFGALPAGSTGEDCYQQYEALTPVADLVRMLRGIKSDPDRVVFSGIIGPDAVENCEDTVPGKRYYTAIGMLGGFQGDICQTNYSELMDSLGEITTGIRTDFPLQHVPDPDTIVVTVRAPDTEDVEVVEDPANGWTYNEDPTAPEILFAGTAIPPRGSEVTIEYTVAGEIQATSG